MQSVSISTLCHQPHSKSNTHPSVLTCWGSTLLLLSPRPSWPYLFHPQAKTSPRLLLTRVCLAPQQTCSQQTGLLKKHTNLECMSTFDRRLLPGPVRHSKLCLLHVWYTLQIRLCIAKGQIAQHSVLETSCSVSFSWSDWMRPHCNRAASDSKHAPDAKTC